MSRTIDERVVSMQFDNKQFENNVQTSLSTLDKLKKALKLDDAAKGLEGVSAAAKKCDLSSLGNSAHTVGLRFNAMYTMADQAFRNIYNSAEMYAKRIVSAFTTDPIKTGFQEYETQINAIQTILANTESKGTTLDHVNQALDTLNSYADKTIYNFTEMTRNIGTFTAAGIGLETSVNSIQGIANLAAVSGSNAQQASTAMYQLSQALASGTVKLMDWNSVVNAGMGGQVFQDALKETARVHGVAIDKMIKEQGSFRETLSEGWITSEILTETLEKFTATTENLTEEQIEANRQMWKSRGYTDDQIDSIFKLGKTATDAATKVKTFTQLWDTLKEAAQSGWTQTWEHIIGDFGEAKELWTAVSDTLGGIIGKSAERRNKLLGEALTSNYDKMIEKINKAGVETTKFESKVKEIAKNHNIDIEKIIDDYGSLEDAFKSGALSSDILKEAVKGLEGSILDLSKVERGLKMGSTGEDVKKVQQALKNLGYDLGTFGDGTGIDGIIGKVTEGAIKKFQEEHGLKVTGIIDDETIAALEKASGTVDGLYGSVKNLIGEVDKLGGRDLLIKSLVNIWNALKKPISAVGEAWRETFKAMSPEQLYGLIEKFHAFTEKLIMNEESAEKVKSVFKGLFAILDVVKTIVGGGLGVAFKLLSKVLGKLDLNILDVAAAAGDALVKFRDWVFENGILAKGFDAVVNGVTKGVIAVRDWIKEFVKMDKVQAAAKKLKKVFVDTFGNVIDKVKQFWELIKNFGKSMETGDTVFGLPVKKIVGLKDIFNFFKTDVIGAFKKIDFGKLFSGISNALKGFRDGVATYLESAGIKLDDVKQKIIDFVAAVKEKLGDNMGTILAIGVLATFLFLVKKIKDAVELIAKPFGAIDDFLGNLGSTLKTFGQAAKASALKNIATSIAILAASVAILALLDQKKVWSAVGAITLLAAELIAMSIVLSKFKPGDFGKMATTMLGLAGALLILAVAAKIIGGMDGDTLLKGGGAIVVFLGIIAIISKATTGMNAWVGEFGKMMLKLSFALLILAGVTKIFGSMKYDTLIQGGAAVAVFLGMMIIMMGATNLLSGSIPKFGSMMLGLSTALLLMAGAVAIFGNMEMSTILQGGAVISAFLVIMMVMMKATKSIGSSAGKFGAMMFGIGAALLMMSASIAILGNMDGETIAKGGLVVAAMMGIMTLMMAATKLLGSNAGSAAKVGVMMIAFAGALLIMTASIALLSVIDGADIDKAINAITKIGLLFGALVVLSRFAGAANTCKGTIITMSIAIGVLALSLAGLSFVDPSKLTGATTALSIVIGMFALLVAATGLMKAATGTMITLAGILLIMSGALILLAKMPIESTLGAAASLSVLILSLSASCLMLSMVPITGALTGVASLAILIAGVGVIMAAIAGLAQAFPGMEDFLNTSIPLLTAIGEGLGSFVGGIVGGFAAGITAGLPEIATNLSDFMTNLSPFIEGSKGIGDDAMTGVKNLAQTILLLTGASLLDSITSFITGGSSLTSFAEQLVPFGSAIAEFSSVVSGNINEEAVTAAANAGKIMSEMASTLPNSGGVVGFFAGENDMGTFAAGLVPFGTAITQFSSIVSGNVNEDAVTAAANAGKMMAEMAATIPNTGGLVSFFAGDNDMVTFAAGLVPFGQAIVSFSTAVSGLDENAVTSAATAGKMMAEMANTIPNTGGLVSFFAGDNDLATFGTQIVSFGTAIKSFSNEVAGINTEAVTAAASAGTSLANLANVLPESGGLWSIFSADNDMSTFASEIVKFGEGISSFSTSVSGISIDAVNTAVSAGSTLTSMANSLTAEGNANLSDFGYSIWTFGSYLSDFSVEIADLDVTAIQTAASELQKLASVDLSGISSIATSLSTIGTDTVSKFLKSFTDAGDRFKTAGETLMKKVVSGVESVSDKLSKAAKSLVSDSVSDIKDYKDDFYDAGDYLVEGFAAGISENDYKAEAKARAMAKAAVEAAEDELLIKSPSRVTYRVGGFFGEGFVNAIVDYGRKSAKAGESIAESAKQGLTIAMAKVRELIESDIDAQPTIRPVLDLSDVSTGAGAISGMFDMSPSVGVMSNLRAINSMMASGQNGMSNDDVVSAIQDLGRKLGDISGDTYQIGDVSYDNGSEVSNAVQSLVRAAKMERRR